MKHYKDANGQVFAYEDDGSQDHLIGDKISIDQIEVTNLTTAAQQALFDNQDYYRKRIYSYPEVGEFLDAWVKNDQTALEEYRQKCLEIKLQFPKPPGF
jgi:hypothetical protein